MTAWELPVTVMVGGQEFAIRSDYRAVLDAISALGDVELEPGEQAAACLRILYPDWEHLPDTAEAFAAAMEFISLGEPVPPNEQPKPKLVDWDKDAKLIAPAVDKVLGYPCRRCEYLHWWEFVGAYMSIGRGPFADVVNIRSKRRRGKKLEPYELEFERENRDLIALPEQQLTNEEEEFFKRLGVT